MAYHESYTELKYGFIKVVKTTKTFTNKININIGDGPIQNHPHLGKLDSSSRVLIRNQTSFTDTLSDTDHQSIPSKGSIPIKETCLQENRKTRDNPS